MTEHNTNPNCPDEYKAWPLPKSEPTVRCSALVSLRPETCSWHRWESGQYETSCDNVFEFTNDGIKENDFKHCPFCGGSIQEKQANAELNDRRKQSES